MTNVESSFKHWVLFRPQVKVLVAASQAVRLTAFDCSSTKIGQLMIVFVHIWPTYH